MNKDILNLKPTNLPIYVYRLKASVALVHDGIGYLLINYKFDNIKVAANQPLHVGDVLDNNSCYYGNGKTELIPNFCKEKMLGGVEGELRQYCGCLITRLAISYVENNTFKSCGIGECTVFIQLSTSDLINKFQALNNRVNELTGAERETWYLLKNEIMAAHNLDYWKTRIPNWDKRFECIGEIPTNLVY